MATGARRPSLARIGAGPERRGRPESGDLGRGIEPRIRPSSIPSGSRNPTAQNAVTDSVEICLLQGLRYYEISRAVIIRSVGRPKIVCVGPSRRSSAGYDFRNGRPRPLSWSTCAGLDRPPRCPQLVLDARMRPLAGMTAHESASLAREVPKDHPDRSEGLCVRPVRRCSARSPRNRAL